MKKTMTINLPENEFKIIEDICEKKGISKIALVRQAIRLYQSVDENDYRLLTDNGLSKKRLLVI